MIVPPLDLTSTTHQQISTTAEVWRAFESATATEQVLQRLLGTTYGTVFSRAVDRQCKAHVAESSVQILRDVVFLQLLEPDFGETATLGSTSNSHLWAEATPTVHMLMETVAGGRT
jgi:hypothetical protein